MGTARSAVSEALVWTKTAKTSATSPSTSRETAIRRRLLYTSPCFAFLASRSSRKLLPVRVPVLPIRVAFPVVRRGPGASRRSARYWALCVFTPLILGADYTEGYGECKLARRVVRCLYISYRGDPIGGPVSARKLVVSTYLQYIALAVGVVLLVSFVRQISGVLLTFLAAGVLAYALNPLVRRLEGLRVPRPLAVIGVFLVLILVVGVTMLLIIVPSVGQVQIVVRNPQDLVDRVIAQVNRLQNIPYIGRYMAGLDQDRILQLLKQNAPSAEQVANVATGVIGGVFGVFGTILNLLLMVLVSVYLLLEREKITRAVLDHGRPRGNDNVLHHREVCPSGRGLGGGDGDHPRHRSLPRGRARGRHRAVRPRRRVLQGPAGSRPFPRSPADRRQPTGAEDTGRLGWGASAMGALRHAGRDGALRSDRRGLRRPHSRHRGGDAALPARDASLRTLGETACQAG